jgi:hypothetical protein
VDGFVKSMGTRPCRISYRSPWQNPVAERWIGGCRRESSITSSYSTSATLFGLHGPTSAISTKTERISASARTLRLAGP